LLNVLAHITHRLSLNGPLIRLTDDNLEDAIKGNEKAERLLKKKKYSRAINKFNSVLEK